VATGLTIGGFSFCGDLRLRGRLSKAEEVPQFEDGDPVPGGTFRRDKDVKVNLGAGNLVPVYRCELLCGLEVTAQQGDIWHKIIRDSVDGSLIDAEVNEKGVDVNLIDVRRQGNRVK
jgi:hypothetical protein